MSLNNGSEREICQLWLVAKYYFDTAIEHYKQIDENQLSLTIKEIVDKFKGSNEIVGMKDLILASANFSSCSIRLYSIDEIQNSRSYQSYRSRIWVNDNSFRKLKNSACVKNAYVKERPNIIHIVLRHMVAHSEAESSSYSEVCKILYSDYINYTISFIKDSLCQIITRIESDISGVISSIKGIELYKNEQFENC